MSEAAASTLKHRAALAAYFTEAEEATRLGVDLRTLRRWRRAGYGPDATRVGRLVIYSEAAERRFLASAEKPVALPAVRRRTANDSAGPRRAPAHTATAE
jgi:hypothetical protein